MGPEMGEEHRAEAGDGARSPRDLVRAASRTAGLGLARAESRLARDRHEVARLARERIERSPRFRAGIGRLAAELERPQAGVAEEASAVLRELATGYNPAVHGLTLRTSRWGYESAYGSHINFDAAQLEQLRDVVRDHACVFLPTHKSYLDGVILRCFLDDHGFPPSIIFGGANIRLPGFGPVMRRGWTVFIRRTGKGDAVYKFVLREYVGYLVEQRFNLEWYMEGGRSRTGKLLPPRMGLLAYVADAYRQGRADDVLLIPVSIAYDQLSDVAEYAALARGKAKEAESWTWLIGYFRGHRHTRYGNLNIRFGELVSLREHLGPPTPDADEDPEEASVALQKVAFEVSVRINRVTPITPISLVTFTLLGSGRNALTLEQVMAALWDPLEYVQRRGLPMTMSAHLDTADGARRALDALMEHQVVTSFTEGPEAVYTIGADQHLSAAYYRNTIIHFFLHGAIAELALARAAEDDVVDAAAAFWDETIELRDVLKFEFFFPEKDEFRDSIAAELAYQDPGWQKRLSEGTEEIRLLLAGFRPLTAHTVLQSFLGAYGVVADELAECGGDTGFEEKRFFDACLARGRQYVLQGRVHSPESVSTVLFQTALQLARNRDLFAPGDDLAGRRRVFAAHLRAVNHRVHGIQRIVADRVAEAVGRAARP